MTDTRHNEGRPATDTALVDLVEHLKGEVEYLRDALERSQSLQMAQLTETRELRRRVGEMEAENRNLGAIERAIEAPPVSEIPYRPTDRSTDTSTMVDTNPYVNTISGTDDDPYFNTGATIGAAETGGPAAGAVGDDPYANTGAVGAAPLPLPPSPPQEESPSAPAAERPHDARAAAREFVAAVARKAAEAERHRPSWWDRLRGRR